MQESAKAALSHVRQQAVALGIVPDVLSKQDLHIHVPAGAIPKDGPSAGVTMATAIVSAARGMPVRPDVAMTGEITLSGLVLPVGGIREKALAARRQGIKTIVLPEGNMQDLIELPEEVRSDLTFVPARALEDVLRVAMPEAVGATGGRRSALPQRQRRRRCREDELIRGRVLHLGPRLRARLPPDRNHQRARRAPAGRPPARSYHRCALAPRTHAERPVSSRGRTRATPGSCRSTAFGSMRARRSTRPRTFYATFDERVAREAALLRDHNVAFVVADAPPLGCAAAAAAGIPSVVVSNFTWDWIYEEYRDELSAAPHLFPLIKQAYGQADAAWRLPIHGGFESFTTIIDVPFVARHARHQRHDTRAAFGRPAQSPAGARVVWRLRRDRPRPAVARLPAALDHPLDRQAADGRPPTGHPRD